MAVKIGHASIDENGKASGGKAGDQTSKEVCIRDWYNKPWNVMLICTDKAIAKQAAAYMEAICKDDDFGYDQGQRATGYLAIVAAGGKVEKAIPSEFDCSSLVASCYKLAGLNVNHQCTTRNLRQALLDTGKFKAYTDTAHLTSDAYAEVGAIYLSEGSHVVMSLGTGSKASSTPAPSKKSNEEIATEVIQGKWGNGDERKTRLANAGYDYNTIQKIVNSKSTPTPAPVTPVPIVSSKPSYTVGKVYTLQVELKVRTEAGTNNTAKTHSQLTADGQRHDVDRDGALDKGTQVTCQAVKNVGNDIWIKAPSGWMAAYYQGEIYIK